MEMAALFLELDFKREPEQLHGEPECVKESRDVTSHQTLSQYFVTVHPDVESVFPEDIDHRSCGLVCDQMFV